MTKWDSDKGGNSDDNDVMLFIKPIITDFITMSNSKKGKTIKK